MGSRGSRRRTRTTVLTVANASLIVVCLGVSAALFSQNAWILRAAAVAAVIAIAASVLFRHQLLVERLAHSDERAQVAQEYSRITSARVVENAEFVDLMQRRLDKIDARSAWFVLWGLMLVQFALAGPWERVCVGFRYDGGARASP